MGYMKPSVARQACIQLITRKSRLPVLKPNQKERKKGRKEGRKSGRKRGRKIGLIILGDEGGGY